jgi:transketolase
MRASFVATLAELAENDPRVVFLTGDLGYMVVEKFAERVPGRFFNVGVAEQNMLGVATGLAEAGYIPFCYSIVPFAALRPYEFIRNGAVLHRLAVRIVGVGGGFEYGHNGPSHYGLEDLGVLRIQPDLAVIAPADHQQTRTALRRTWDLAGPVYYRLGKDEKTTIPGLDGRFELGRAELVRDGHDVLLVATGGVTTEAVAAAEQLAARGVSAGVMVVASVSPAPVEDLARALRRFPVVVSVEAHYVVGGLGSLVSEVAAEHGIGCRVVRCGVRTAPGDRSGSQDYMHRLHGLSSEQLVDAALRALQSAPQVARR